MEKQDLPVHPGAYGHWVTPGIFLLDTEAFLLPVTRASVRPAATSTAQRRPSEPSRDLGGGGGRGALSYLGRLSRDLGGGGRGADAEEASLLRPHWEQSSALSFEGPGLVQA